MKPAIIHSAVQKIFIDFQLDEEKVKLPEEEKPQLEQLKKIVSTEIAYLIDHNLDKLKWILYRIDVNEQRLMQALSENSAADAPDVIADMIIERQLEKAETRAKYGSGEGDWEI